MAAGTVTWFDIGKGFGFIQPQNGRKNIVVPVTARQPTRINSLNDGQKFTCDVVTEHGKQGAATLKFG